MPTQPKRVANGVKKMFPTHYYPVIVAETEYLDKALKRVYFKGDLSNTCFQPGNAIEFRVSNTEFRYYTPSFYDKQRGIFEVIFYLHGHGPGSHWANELKEGDTTWLIAPGGKMRFCEEYRHHFFFGDESTLGLYRYLKSAVHASDRDYLCLLELDHTHCHWPGLLEFQAEVVGKSDETPGVSAVDSLTEMDGNLWNNWQKASFYLSGRAQSIQKIHKKLLEKGVAPNQIQIHPYWASGKKGL